MESDKTMFWSMIGFLSLQSSTLPGYLQQLYKLWKSYRDNLSSFSHIDIHEMEESSMGRSSNEIYSSVGMYLSSLEATANAPRVSVSRPRRNSSLTFSLPSEHTVKDEFEGAQIWWTHEVKTDEKQGSRDRGGRGPERKYVLKISNIDRPRVLSSYIDRISTFADDLQRRSQERKLFSNGEGRGRSWSPVAFNHPSTFQTLALDPLLKDKVMKDLDCFQQSREFYRKTGRAWKRGYLLYGPPGTGKSSLIAAIANYMNYDVYDLELTKVFDNSALRELLLGTASKSVIVIEDIDCAANLPDKAMCRRPSRSGKEGKPKDSRRSIATVTLSGLLNFADGLWSSCGEERIMIFTTNHKNRLDPALLRSGRMDMHILLSYCGFPAFKQLVHNYLDIKDHIHFPSVEEKMESGGRLTPAEICEILIQNQSDHDSAIMAVIAALQGSIAWPALDASSCSESESDSDSLEDEEEEDSSSSAQEE